MKASTQSVVLSALIPVKIDEYDQIKLNKSNILVHLKKNTLHDSLVSLLFTLFFAEVQKLHTYSNFKRASLSW